jgi:hypothetical protein
MDKKESEIIKEIREERNNLFRMTYKSAASDPRQWLSYARSLKYTSNLLKPVFIEEHKTPRPRGQKNYFPITVSPIYLMIVGFAVENYLKGIYVISNPDIIENDKLVKLNRHDILKLLYELKFEISKEEIYLVERLEEFVLWAGRYPIPAKFERLIPKKHREGTKFDFIVYSLPTDVEIAQKLLERLEERLMKDMGLK